MPFCKKCGYEVGSDDQFCQRCGAPLVPIARQGKTRSPEKPAKQKAPAKLLAKTRKDMSPPEKPPAKSSKQAGKHRIKWPVILVIAVAVVAIVLTPSCFTGCSTPGELILKDDFSNTDSGWYTASGDWGGTTYSNGEFKIYLETEDWAYTTNENVGRQTDFIVEVDARKIPEGEDTTDCGILFRYQDTKNFYGLYVQPLGKYSVWKRVEGTWTSLIEWTESEYIQTGTSTNKLKVVCQGQNLDYYINGHKVDTINDDTFAAGKIALSVTSTEETPTTEYLFDNFRIYTLETSVEQVPTGKLPFEDDFSNTDSGWFVGIFEGGGTAEYSNGELKLYRDLGWGYTRNKNVDEQTDFVVEVDARKIPEEGEEGKDRGSCAIFFRLHDDKNYYYFCVRPSLGEYYAGRRKEGYTTVLIEGTKSDYIKTGTSTNKLKVVCQGQKMDFYVNDYKLNTVEDDTFAAGETALAVYETGYLFDNFKLYPVAATQESTTTEQASQDTSTESTDEWLVYEDEVNGYSVEYPSSWTLDTSFAYMGTVRITEPENNAIISTNVQPVLNTPLQPVLNTTLLDDLVSEEIDYKKQDYFYFELISNDSVTHEGNSARIVECVYQEEQEDSRYRSSELFMVIDEVIFKKSYSIELRVTPPSDYDSYSDLFPKIMSSFHVP